MSITDSIISILPIVTIITTLLTIVLAILQFIPDNKKEKLRYEFKKFIRHIIKKHIITKLIIKSNNVENLELEAFRSKLNKKFTDVYDDIKKTQNGFSFDVVIGSNKILTNIDIMTNDAQFVTQLQCTFKSDCKTSNLKSCIMNYMSAFIHLKDNLNDIDVQLNRKFVLSCELKSLYKINKILELGNLDVISGENNGKIFEMYKNKILVYDEDFTPEFIKIVDDIMINYA